MLLERGSMSTGKPLITTSSRHRTFFGEYDHVDTEDTLFLEGVEWRYDVCCVRCVGCERSVSLPA
jgi:hypothetical protein